MYLVFAIQMKNSQGKNYSISKVEHLPLLRGCYAGGSFVSEEESD